MTVGAIHQIYWTHCTYGTSVLERRTGEQASDVLGYSARASSLSGRRLREKYNLMVDRVSLPVYNLPSDTPARQQEQMGPSDAPFRLLYRPSETGLQVLGQIAYRQKDTSQPPRIGSYFGHMLLSETGNGNKPWDVLECLRLWGAPWVDSDSPDDDFGKLDDLVELADLRGGADPAIDDDVLLSFLTTPQGEPFQNDPQHVIADRWNKTTPAERTDLLVDVLRHHLDFIGSKRRVMLVVEPSVAALLFYGVARLIADKTICDNISFSTFEPNPAKSRVSLAATCFQDCDSGDLSPEIYARQGFVKNTFRLKASQPAKPKRDYAELMVGTLVSAGGWNAVQALLDGFKAARPQVSKDLQQLAEAHQFVAPALLQGSLPSSANWQQSKVAKSYVGNAIRRQLTGDSSSPLLLKKLANSESRMTVLDLLLGGSQTEKTKKAAQFLLRNVPPDQFPQMLASERIDNDCKVETLAHYINTNHKFPDNCQALWQWTGQEKGRQSGQRVELLPSVLAKVDTAFLTEVLPQLAKKHHTKFMLALVEACRINREKESALSVIENLGEADFVNFLDRYADFLLQRYPKQRKHFGEKLQQVFDGLLRNPKQFEKRLKLMRDWSDFLLDPDQIETNLGHWENIRNELLRLRQTPEEESSGVFKRRPKSQIVQIPWSPARIAKTVAETMRRAVLESTHDDENGKQTRKLLREFLRQLCTQLVGNTGCFPEDVWRDIDYFFSGPYYRYPEQSLADLAAHAPPPTSRTKRPHVSIWEKLSERTFRNWLLACVAVLLCTFVLPFVFLWLKGRSRSSAKDSVAAADEARAESGAQDMKLEQKSEESGSGGPGKEPQPNREVSGDDRPKDAQADGLQSVTPADNGTKEPAENLAENAAADEARAESGAQDMKLEEKSEESGSGGPGKPAENPAGKTAGEEPRSAAPDSSTVYKSIPTLALPAGGMMAVDKGYWSKHITNPIPLTPINEQADAYSVTLHGLNRTNELLIKTEAGFQLKKKGDGARTIIGLSSNDSSDMSETGKFFFTDKQFRFMWTRIPRSDNETTCLNMLSNCVVEVKHKDTNRSCYIVLHGDIVLEKLPLEHRTKECMRTATLDSKSLNTDFPAVDRLLQDFDFFFLGNGKLHLDDDDPIEFTEDERVSPREIDIQDLPKEFKDLGMKKIRVELQRTDKDVWQLAVRQDELLDFHRKWLLVNKAVTALTRLYEQGILKGPFPASQVTVSYPDYSMAEDVQNLAKYFAETSEGEEKDLLEEISRWKSPTILRKKDTVDSKIRVPAQKLDFGAITTERDTLKVEYLARKTNFERVTHISVVLYRMVDGKIRTDDIKIGDPYYKPSHP